MGVHRITAIGSFRLSGSLCDQDRGIFGGVGGGSSASPLPVGVVTRSGAGTTSDEVVVPERGTGVVATPELPSAPHPSPSPNPNPNPNPNPSPNPSPNPNPNPNPNPVGGGDSVPDSAPLPSSVSRRGIMWEDWGEAYSTCPAFSKVWGELSKGKRSGGLYLSGGRLHRAGKCVSPPRF